MNAIDTNVLAYSVDADAPDKRVVALRLLESLNPAETVLPWQVVCELGSVLVKFSVQGRVRSDGDSLLGLFATRFRVVMPERGILEDAMRLRRTHQLSYWDSLLIGACIAAGVTRLYTQDVQSRPVIEGVEIVNPFGGTA